MPGQGPHRHNPRGARRPPGSPLRQRRGGKGGGKRTGGGASMSTARVACADSGGARIFRQGPAKFN